MVPLLLTFLSLLTYSNAEGNFDVRKHLSTATRSFFQFLIIKRFVFLLGFYFCYNVTLPVIFHLILINSIKQHLVIIIVD